jgi:drug/metabolite transporter (DMT)-like permease
MSLTPVLVLVLSVLFMKETTTSLKIIGTLLSILGAFLIIIQRTKSGLGSNNLLGIGLSVLSALSYAIYLLVTGNISVKYKPVTVVKYMFFFSLLMILPFGFTSFSTQKMFSSEVTTVAIMQLSFALLFSTVLAFFLMPIALSKLKASTVSIYMNLQPLTASIVAIVIGQDTFSWDKPLTAVLVIAGVYLVTGNEK